MLKTLYTVMTLVMGSLWAEPLLIEDSACIPNVLKELDPTLSKDTIEDVQRVYSVLSKPRAQLNFESAHIVWRLMAALQATGDQKAIALYNHILQSGYAQPNNRLERIIGFTWLERPMNDVEKHILEAATEALTYKLQTNITHRDAYLACLLSVLKEYYTNPNDPRVKQLPMTLWPSAMVEDEINRYLENSHLRNQYNTPEEKAQFQEGCRKLIKRFDNCWRDQASVCEQFYWNADFPLPDVDSYRCQYWSNLCKAQDNFGSWKDFTAWANPMIQGMYPNHKARMLQGLASVWVQLGGQMTDFTAWASPTVQGVDEAEKARTLRDLASVWVQLGGQVTEFMAWANPVVQVIMYPSSKASALQSLAPVWVQLGGQVTDFMTWASPTVQGMTEDVYNKAGALQKLASVWVQLGGQVTEFMAWANPMVQGMSPRCKAEVLQSLASVWVQLGGKMTEFMTWASPTVQGVGEAEKARTLRDLASVWIHLGGRQVAEFMAWANPVLEGVHPHDKVSALHNLASIWVHNLKNDFDDYWRKTNFWHNSDYGALRFLTFCEYINRSYLNDLRIQTAWEAEGQIQHRVWSLAETKINHFLPVLWAQDPHMAQVRANQGAVNAHEFDSIYPGEYALLDTWCQDHGYQEQPGQNLFTRYHNHEVKPDYQTNAEVENFLSYVADHFKASEASLIRQMLGVEPKANRTSGTFAPYLGSSMYYAKSDAPKGDEFLGRIWWFVKNVAEEKGKEVFRKTMSEENVNTLGRGKALEEANKAKTVEINTILKSVGLAILEAAEVRGGQADTHCQTRITGELMKCLCWHLEGSQLRQLIAAMDAVNPQDDETIDAQIIIAPVMAQQILEGIEDGGRNHRILNTVDTSPELCRIYHAIYNDFYGQSYNRLILKNKKTGQIYGETSPENLEAAMESLPLEDDITVIFEDIRHDEHLLERDMQTGALVSKYNANGSLRDTPLVKYSQAVFTAVEKAFTDLIRVKYEEQRGLKY